MPIAPESAATVKDIEELATLFVAPLSDGARCYVTSRRQIYLLEKTSGALADGSNVVAPDPGAPIAGEPLARWIRQAGVFGPGAPVASVVWKPGSTNIGEAKDWADVMQFVNATVAPIQVFCDNSLAPLVIPAGLYDLGGKVTLSPPENTTTLGGPTVVVVTVQDGAVLHNLAGLQGTIQIESTSSAPILTFTPVVPGSFVIFRMLIGSMFVNSGTAPMVQPTTPVIFLMDIFSGYGPSAPGQVMVDVPAGQIVIVVGLHGPVLPNDWASGAPGSTLVYILDDTLNPFPSLAGFLGTVQQQMISGLQCTTLTRPGPGGLKVGFSIFDTNLGIPIWWSGAGWVDATGAPA